MGIFVGAPEAAEYSRSQLFSGQEIEVVVRFSLAGGDPEASDTEKSPRGLCLQFRLPGAAARVFIEHCVSRNCPANVKEWMIQCTLRMAGTDAATLFLNHGCQDWRDIIPRITLPTLVIGGGPHTLEVNRMDCEADTGRGAGDL